MWVSFSGYLHRSRSSPVCAGRSAVVRRAADTCLPLRLALYVLAAHRYRTFDPTCLPFYRRAPWTDALMVAVPPCHVWTVSPHRLPLPDTVTACLPTRTLDFCLNTYLTATCCGCVRVLPGCGLPGFATHAPFGPRGYVYAALQLFRHTPRTHHAGHCTGFGYRASTFHPRWFGTLNLRHQVMRHEDPCSRPTNGERPVFWLTATRAAVQRYWRCCRRSPARRLLLPLPPHTVYHLVYH